MSLVGPVLILGTSALSVLVAWYVWTRAQRRLHFDLKDIPGPKQQPLIGNLGFVFGSSQLHKVNIPDQSRVRPMSYLQQSTHQASQ